MQEDIQDVIDTLEQMRSDVQDALVDVKGFDSLGVLSHLQQVDHYLSEAIDMLEQKVVELVEEEEEEEKE